MLPKEIEDQLPILFRDHFGEEFLLRSVNMLGGGSINRSLLLKTNLGDFFIKYNLAGKYPQMFESEAKGLKRIEDTLSLKTPKLYFTGQRSTYAFIILEYIHRGQENEDFWRAFALSLASMHKNTSDKPGLDFNNYIGSLPQVNEPESSWAEFFINKRLQPMIKRARDNQMLDNQINKTFNRLFSGLENIFPHERVSLLHGDFWSGNFLIGNFNDAFVIDPAIYYGSREMDIAMSMLFGGFPKRFYDYYNEFFPLENEWEERIDICNLYPLMVHVNLFGTGYLSSVKQILQKF